MKTIISYATGLIIALMLAGVPVDAASNSDDLEKGLQLMREEEKLAHDVYIALYEKWQIPVFNNIASAESRHFDAVGYLLETKGLDDPVFAKEGKFSNRELAKLYEELVEKGSISITTALEVGAYVEELDIQDLQEQLAAGHDDLTNRVLGNLERASEVHLRAFTKQLAFRGAEYSPQVLDEATFLSLTDSAPQRAGRGQCIYLSNNNTKRPVMGRQNMRMRGRGQGMRGNCIYN